MTARTGKSERAVPCGTSEGLRLRVGAALVLISIVPKVCFWLMPFLGLSVAGMGACALILVTVNGVLIWVGVFLVGRAAYRAVKRRGVTRMPSELWRMLRTGHATTRPADETGGADSHTSRPFASSSQHEMETEKTGADADPANRLHRPPR